MAELVVVRSKIKQYAKHKNKQLNVSSDFADELSKEVERLIAKAAQRAIENNRSTVKARDL